MGGSQRFCVQCGHELKHESRFCAACGRAVAGTSQPNLGVTGGQEITAPEQGITATMTAFPREDPVHQELVAADPVWPSQRASEFVAAAPRPAPRDNSRAPGGTYRHSSRRSRRWWPLVFPGSGRAGGRGNRADSLRTAPVSPSSAQCGRPPQCATSHHDADELHRPLTITATRGAGREQPRRASRAKQFRP